MSCSLSTYSKGKSVNHRMSVWIVRKKSSAPRMKFLFLFMRTGTCFTDVNSYSVTNWVNKLDKNIGKKERQITRHAVKCIFLNPKRRSLNKLKKGVITTSSSSSWKTGRTFMKMTSPGNFASFSCLLSTEQWCELSYYFLDGFFYGLVVTFSK